MTLSEDIPRYLCEYCVRERLDKPEPIDVKVGDRMRFSTELLVEIYRQAGHLSETVQLVDVRVEVDGSKTLVVERFLPCDCGCGKLCAGGRMEAAHPDDYRHDERA
jgi:hypothetical protein